MRAAPCKILVVLLGVLSCATSKVLQAASRPAVAIVYSYHESSPRDVENLQFFIAHGIFTSNDALFVLLISGEQCSAKLPASNPHLLVHQRPNTGGDLCAFAEAVAADSTLAPALKRCDFFIFINSSARGPFLPRYVSPSAWPWLFIDQIVDDVVLVGPAVSCKDHPHVQTWAFATSRVGVERLVRSAFRCAVGGVDGKRTWTLQICA